MGSSNSSSTDFNHAHHSPINATSPTCIFNKVCDFQKGIRHDIMLYPILKDDQQYNNWYCETHAIAFTHGTKAVFFPHYRPTKTPQA